MILTDRRKKERPPRALYATLLLLALAFAGPPVYRMAKSGWWRAGSKTTELPACGAEYREGKFFRDGAYLFDNGNTQSGDRAHSGRYSCRLSPGEGLQFGIGVRMEDLRPGGLYQATVWRFRHPGSNRSYLAAQAEGGKAPFYLTQPFSFDRDEKGWEQIRLQFFIPFRDRPKSAQVYVFSDGKDTVYFDDFQVRLLRTFDEAEFELPVLDLTLDKDALAKLKAKRAEALRAGLLETGPGDWVKGKFQWKGSESPVAARVRLKGDWLDHLNAGKWSFRVALAGDNFWKGMQTFSLQHPGTRYYLHEWLLHECWQREGVLTTGYDFAELRLNGESLGLYAVEEHFEKYLVERQGRREGPILKLDESGFWDGLRQQIALAGEISPSVQLPSALMSNAAVGPFDPDRTAESLELAAMSRHAASLVEQFRLGTRPARDLFDLDRMARFYAIADVMDAHHSTAWHNLRFYYNPVSDRLEPVGFDGFGTGPTRRSSFLLQGFSGPDKKRPYELQDLLFLDTAFVEKYVACLFEYSNPAFLNGFFESVAGTRLPRELALLREYPQYAFQEQEFIRSVQYRRAMLLPQSGYCLQTRRAGDGRTWEIRNYHSYPLQLLGYAHDQNGRWSPLPAPLWLPSAPGRPLFTETARDSSGAWLDLEQFRSQAGALIAGDGWEGPAQVDLPSGARWLVYRMPGLDSLFRQELQPGPPAGTLTPRQELFDRPFPLRDPRWVLSHGSIRFLPGRHTVADMIVVPEGYSVEAGPGTTLDFVKGGGFLSRSPVHFAGQSGNPVTVTSSDGTGNGFTVLGPSGEASTLEYVVFEKLRSLQWKDWTQTGAVTFFNTTLRISDCIFRGTRSEDALNLVQSEVDMDHCLFLDQPSDGFDCDFCKGEIRNTSFRQCQNDGLDLSGSLLRLESGIFEACGEKGISVGERSDLACFDTRIANTPTGIAVKDQSVTIADKLVISGCGTGFSVFCKKPEYGPARLVVREHEAKEVGRLYAVQQGSTLQLGEKLIKGTDR